MMNAALLLAAATATPVAAVAKPEADSKPVVFGDWALVCQRRDTLPPCEIAQAVLKPDDADRKMQISMAYAGRDDRYAIQIRLPLGLLVQPEALLRLGKDNDLPGYRITRCERDGCYIDRLLTRKDIEPLLGAETALLAVAQTNGKPLAFSISMKGVATAMQAMVERNSAWAKAAGAEKAAPEDARNNAITKR